MGDSNIAAIISVDSSARGSSSRNLVWRLDGGNLLELPGRAHVESGVIIGIGKISPQWRQELANYWTKVNEIKLRSIVQRV